VTTLVVIDSGTSRTRARLWTGAHVGWTGERPVGARDTAIDGHNAKLRVAITELLAELLASAAVRPEAAVCSGMITSNNGLLEVPHLSAPAGPDQLARGLVRQEFPEIASIPFHFVRGVKTLPRLGDPLGLAAGDVLRGEEAEAIGLRELTGLQGPLALVHFGSHHKVVEVAADGTILRSRTAITGELLAAVSEHTILRSSLEAGLPERPDPEMWRAGLALARTQGLGRALFLVRVGEQIGGRSKFEMTSFLLGALLSQDLPLLEDARRGGARVVLYGGGVFPGLLKEALEDEGWSDVALVSGEQAELAAVIGAARLYERWKELS
jgi:2-dehydro-3-deoxygalactonokinase